MRPLLDLMANSESGMVDKAAYVLHSLVDSSEGRSAAVEEGGIHVLVEMVEAGTSRQKEIATLSLLQICDDNAAYRTMAAREGAIPPLVALSQSSSARPKLRSKVHTQIPASTKWNPPDHLAHSSSGQYYGPQTNPFSNFIRRSR